MEKALTMKTQRGVEAAADLLEASGVNRELAILALVGSKQAERYGVRIDMPWKKESSCSD